MKSRDDVLNYVLRHNEQGICVDKTQLDDFGRNCVFKCSNSISFKLFGIAIRVVFDCLFVCLFAFVCLLLLLFLHGINCY